MLVNAAPGLARVNTKGAKYGDWHGQREDVNTTNYLASNMVLQSTEQRIDSLTKACLSYRLEWFYAMAMDPSGPFY